MTGNRVKFGLTLPNRGVVIGATTVAEMLQLATDAELAGWDSVWVGDSIFAKPRLDAMVLLGAIAARTTRLRIGPACFASTPLRDALPLAYQWASLDFLSGGRTIFVACQGKPSRAEGAFEKEFAHFGIEPSSRMRRMEEAIEILRLDLLARERRVHWTRLALPQPHRAAAPCSAADPRSGSTANPDLKKRRNAEQAYRRVARLGDGWMTTFKSPEARAGIARHDPGIRARNGARTEAGFRGGRSTTTSTSTKTATGYSPRPSGFSTATTRSITAKTCSGAGRRPVRPRNAFKVYKEYVEAGATIIRPRVAGYDQERQFKRVTEEILPAFS